VIEEVRSLGSYGRYVRCVNVLFRTLYYSQTMVKPKVRCSLIVLTNDKVIDVEEMYELADEALP